MLVDNALIGVLVTVLVALLGLSYGYGVLTNKVKSNRHDIEKQDKEHKDTIVQLRTEFRSYQNENKADHKEISEKLGKLLQGQRSKGDKQC